MPAEDLSSAQLAESPLDPLADVTAEGLTALGTRVAQRTWADGLDRWFWGEGVALAGLAAFGQASGSGDDKLVRDWIAQRLTPTPHIEHVNDVAPAAAAIAVGFGSELKPFAEWVAAAPRSPSGALEHWPGDLWADTVFMAGAFLARLGRATGDTSLIEEAGRQFVLHAQVLQDEQTGLFAHGSHRGETIWCFWGRANAWAALAAVEFLEASSDLQVAYRDEISQRLGRQLTSLIDCQPEHGVWDVLVDGRPETSGIGETSATAGLAAALLRAAALQARQPGLAGQLDQAERTRAAGWLALRAALAHVDDCGYLTRVSAGTILQLIPFGYSVIRSDRPQPWGQGLVLSAIAAALSATAEGRG
jgi:unsaturated rhamnogalacturonyl hydrolase